MKKTILSTLFVLSCCGLSLAAEATENSDVGAIMTALDTQVRVLSEKLKAQKAKSGAPVPSSAVRSTVLSRTSPALMKPQILNPDLALAVANDCNSDGPVQSPSEEPSQACAPNCTVRLSNGSCASYGPDYCAYEASCSPNCTVRLSNGDCASYGPDVCS